MDFYIQLDDEGYIRDCIEYSYGSYVPIMLTTPLPIGFIGGWYRWDGEKAMFDQAKYDELNPSSDEGDDERMDEIRAILRGEVEVS